MSSCIKLVTLIKALDSFPLIILSNNLLLNLLFNLNRKVWIFIDGFLGWWLNDVIWSSHNAYILSFLCKLLCFRNNASNLWRQNILKLVVDKVMGRRTEWLFLWLLKRNTNFIAKGKVQGSRLIDASDHNTAWCWRVYHWQINISHLWHLLLRAHLCCLIVLRVLNLRI